MPRDLTHGNENFFRRLFRGTRLPQNPLKSICYDYVAIWIASLRSLIIEMRKYHFLIALIVLALDRLTKWTIAHRLSMHDTITVIPGFFRIIHTENPGAAFGIFADSPSPWKVALLIVFSMIALFIVSMLLWKNSHALTSTGIGLSLILGGAIGNLWDRIVSRQVVDFLLFYVGRYQWPAFNVADSAIVIGAGLLVFEILFVKSSSQQSA